MLEGGQSLFLELVNDIIYMVSLREGEDPSTAKVEYVNRKVKDITGYEPEDFVKDPSLWVKLVHPRDKRRAIESAVELIKKRRGVLREYRVRTSDGRYIWVEDRIIPVFEKGRVVGFIGIARDITRRKVLTDLSLIALEGKLEELLEKAVLWTAQSLRADLVVVYEVPEGSSEGVLRAGYGVDKKLVNRLRLPLREGTEFYYVYSSQVPVVIEDVDKERRFRLSPDTFLLGLRSGLCIPVRGAGGKPYGALCIYFKEGRSFSREEVDFAESVAGILGLAIGKSRFEKDLMDAEKKLQKINRLYRTLSVVGELILRERGRESLLRKVCSAVSSYGGFAGMWIGLIEGNELNIVSTCTEMSKLLQTMKRKIKENVRKGEGPCGRALRTGEVVINNDTEKEVDQEDIREEMLKSGLLSSAVVPLKLNGKVVGILALYASEKGFFDTETVELVREIGEELSFALDFLEKEGRLHRFSLAVEQTSDWVLITDKEGVIQYANRAVEEISGYRREELIGKKPNLLKSGRHPESFYRRLWETILSGRSFRSIFVNRRKDGEIFYLDQTITPIKDKEGRIVGFVATGKDITYERELRERLVYVTLYDPVTELPNRNNFMERLSFHISRTKAAGRVLAVGYMDVDRFKYVNETYGYQVGDRILREIARRVKNSLRPGDTAARLGSDEFGLILTDMSRKEDIPNVLSKVLKAFEEPFRADGEELRLNVRIGVSVFPDDGSDPEELVRKAEMTLSHAKEMPSGGYQFFTEEMNTRIAEFMLMEKHLSKALEKGEYVLHFQPVYDLKTSKIESLEALLRWNSEDLGLVPPSKFIPVLEETGLINEVGEWVLREACKKVEEWNVPISVNVSAAQFRDEGFPGRVKEILRESGVPGGYLIFEITESVIMENVDFTKKSLSELKDLGVKIAVDDFGTGYSSLAYLKILPVDVLKIDTSFVRDIDRDPNDRAIVNAIVQLAKNLGLRVIAEGIEKERHLEILKKMGCDLGQGYFLSKPLPEEEVPQLLGL